MYVLLADINWDQVFATGGFGGLVVATVTALGVLLSKYSNYKTDRTKDRIQEGTAFDSIARGHVERLSAENISLRQDLASLEVKIQLLQSQHDRCIQDFADSKADRTVLHAELAALKVLMNAQTAATVLKSVAEEKKHG
jgi:hypothetical protein